MRKSMHILCLFCMILFSMPVKSHALSLTALENGDSTTPVLRLSGADRYGTAAAICREGWRSSEYVVIACGGGDDKFADALAGSPIAYALGAPILLTAANELNPLTRNEIIRLGSKKSIILGGTEVISMNVEKQLSDMGLSVERLYGSDRYITAVEIAEKLNDFKPLSRVFITDAYTFQYPVMISPYASRNGIPIIFTEKNSLNGAVYDSLIKWDIKRADIIGSFDIVSQQVEDKLKDIGIETVRVQGKNISDTNINVVNTYRMDTDYIAAARGDIYADSIAGAPYAASKNMSVILTGRNSADTYISNYLAGLKLKCAYVFGGVSGISDYIIDTIREGNTASSNTFGIVDNTFSIVGNTSGNIINGGLAASKDGYIYYSSGSMGGRLYKAKADGTESFELCGDAAAGINVMGEWIYYINLTDNMSVYKIRTDGSCRLKLNDDRSMNITVIDNWIYYINHSDNRCIYKIASDGTMRSKLNAASSKYMIARQGWIYYINTDDDCSIYRFSCDNPEEMQKLSNVYADCMDITGNKIYFSNKNDGGSLYCISIDSTGLAKLCQDEVCFIHVRGNQIYFAHSGDEGGLYRIEADGTGKTSLFDKKSCFINMAGNSISFISIADEPQYIKVMEDGIPLEQYGAPYIKDFMYAMIGDGHEGPGSMPNEASTVWTPVIPEDGGIPVREAFNDDGKKIAFLTFDDGPSKSVTPAILDILKENNIPATFFTVGRMVKNNGDIIKRISEEGHTIGNHSYSHEYDYIYSSTSNFLSEIDACENELKQILGDKFTTRIFRFPGGSFGNSHSEYKEALREHGYEYINWNVSAGDAEGTRIPADTLLQNIKDTSAGKEHIIVLMHDLGTKTTTVEALPKIIEYLKSLGYKFKKLV